jgi:CRISPR-associated protein Cas5t
VEALRVTLEGPTASFRYPHFIYGRQPSFGAPPPATLRGLVAAAQGGWEGTAGLEMACAFTFQARADDLETLHIAEAGGGRIPKGSSWPLNLVATPTPFRRETLFFPRLTLYIRGSPSHLDRLRRAFLQPRYALTLGRSQDLATVAEAEPVSLDRSAEAYLEPGLYPAAARSFLREGHVVMMPVSVSVPRRDRVRWDRFIVTERRVTVDRQVPELWVDPAAETWRGRRRGVVFLGALGPAP